MFLHCILQFVLYNCFVVIVAASVCKTAVKQSFSQFCFRYSKARKTAIAEPFCANNVSNASAWALVRGKPSKRNPFASGFYRAHR